MQVAGLLITGPWGILAVPSERIALQPGQVIRVFFAFNYRYRGDEPLRITLHGFIGNRQPDGTFRSVADDRATVDLAPSIEFTPWEGAVDIATGGGFLGIGKTPEGTYDLMVRVDEFPGVYAEVAGCIEITSGASDMTGMLNMVMMLAVLGMVAPMMTEGVAE
jgi:hypothetical protein